MLKAADRSSLVTVILQELPPVETQDQRCRAKRTRVEGSKRGALAAATPGTRAAVRTGSSQGLPIPAPAVATAGTQAWGAGAQAPSRRAAWAHPIPASAVAIGMGRGGPHPEAARLSVEETLRGKCLIFLPQEIQRPSGLNSSDRPQPLIGHSQSRWVGGTHTTVSDSSPPHGLQPTRLLCLWHFLGRNTGVGCHFLLQGIFPIQGYCGVGRGLSGHH